MCVRISKRSAAANRFTRTMHFVKDQMNLLPKTADCMVTTLTWTCERGVCLWMYLCSHSQHSQVLIQTHILHMEPEGWCLCWTFRRSFNYQSINAAYFTRTNEIFNVIFVLIDFSNKSSIERTSELCVVHRFFDPQTKSRFQCVFNITTTITFINIIVTIRQAIAEFCHRIKILIAIIKYKKSMNLWKQHKMITCRDPIPF